MLALKVDVVVARFRFAELQVGNDIWRVENDVAFAAHELIVVAINKGGILTQRWLGRQPLKWNRITVGVSQKSGLNM